MRLEPSLAARFLWQKATACLAERADLKPLRTQVGPSLGCTTSAEFFSDRESIQDDCEEILLVLF